MLAAALAAAASLTVVQANVGNVNGACANQKFKLCQAPVEARAAKALQAIKPDVVAFEEILPDTDQPAKLLGSGYTIQCDTRFGWDCLAVRKASGVTIEKRLTTRKVVKGCDDTGFTLNRATLRYRKHDVAVAVAHPDSDSQSSTCRAAQLKDLFATFTKKGRVLALGDWNLDPYREKDSSVTAFKTASTYLGLRLATGKTYSLIAGSSMASASGEDLDDGSILLPYPFSERTLDHVLTRKVPGACKVQRIDGGGGMDHRAQVCKLKL